MLKSAYEFDKGIYDIIDFEDNYRADVEYAKKHSLNFVSLRLYPNKDPYDAGIIEVYFPGRKIVSNQGGDYICHRGVRETWGFTAPHLDVGRFKRFSIPECWTIVDEYFFGKPTRI